MKPIEEFSERKEADLQPADRPPFVWSGKTGELTIKGHAASEDMYQYLDHIRDCVDEYMKDPMPTTTLTINLEHLYGITSHYLYGIIQKICLTGNHVVVHWEFKAGDEDALAQGQILASICKAKFRFIRIYPEKD